jgi:hypothetical protein
MAMRVVLDNSVLLALEGVEWNVGSPVGPNSVPDVGVSSCPDKKALEPREVLRACEIHVRLYLITRETYNMIGAGLFQ